MQKLPNFMGLGSKNYGYEFIENETVKSTWKVKGLTQDYTTSKLISFDKMMQWLKDERDTFNVKVKYRHRNKNDKDRRVYSDNQFKTYKFVYDKRVILGQTEWTILYGYK